MLTKTLGYRPKRRMLTTRQSLLVGSGRDAEDISGMFSGFARLPLPVPPCRSTKRKSGSPGLSCTQAWRSRTMDRGSS